MICWPLTLLQRTLSVGLTNTCVIISCVVSWDVIGHPRWRHIGQVTVDRIELKEECAVGLSRCLPISYHSRINMATSLQHWEGEEPGWCHQSSNSSTGRMILCNGQPAYAWPHTHRYIYRYIFMFRPFLFISTRLQELYECRVGMPCPTHGATAPSLLPSPPGCSVG